MRIFFDVFSSNEKNVFWSINEEEYESAEDEGIFWSIKSDDSIKNKL